MHISNAIITGASRGIGRATALFFAEAGYRVIANYCHSEREAVALRDEIVSKGQLAELYRADVADPMQVQALFAHSREQFGSIDVVINNAGISQSKLITDITAQDWQHMIDVNLAGVFYCCQQAARYMVPQKCGKIINISSIWGMVGASCEVHYSAVKAGVIGLTKALAKELAPSNIQVNCIAPGIVETDMLSEFSPEELQTLAAETPLMRLGKSEDIASSVLFLASGGADYITGQVLSPNGGFVI